MKAKLLLLSLKFVRVCLRSYGWRYGHKPPGFKDNAARPYWRLMEDKPNQIETATFSEAINDAIKHARGKTSTPKHTSP